jgi:hypothetical protein
MPTATVKGEGKELRGYLFIELTFQSKQVKNTLPRTARLDIPELLQHVIDGGFERRDISLDDEDRSLFLENYIIYISSDCHGNLALCLCTLSQARQRQCKRGTQDSALKEMLKGLVMRLSI